MRALNLPAVAGLMALLGVACGPAATGNDGGSDGGLLCPPGSANTGTSALTADAGPDAGATLTCQNDPRVTPYAPCVTAVSQDGKFQVTFLEGQPASPAVGLDSWTVRVTDGSGNPLPNLPAEACDGGPCTPFDLLLWMPDHGHGSNPPPITQNADGSYSISEGYLFMPGVWRFTFNVADDGGLTDSAVIYFCITG